MTGPVETDYVRLADRLILRVLEVYRPAYVAEAGNREPDSLLGLTLRLHRSLWGGDEDLRSAASVERACRGCAIRERGPE